MASIRGRSIDNINKKYARGSSYSPPTSNIPGQNVVVQRVSTVAQPLARASTVVTGTPVSIMQGRSPGYVGGSVVRSISPTYGATNSINYPSINTSAAQALISGPPQQQVIRRSTVITPAVTQIVQPTSTVMQHPFNRPPTQLIQGPTQIVQQTSDLIPIDRKIVEVVETRTPGPVTQIVQTHGGHIVDTPSMPIKPRRTSGCPSWLWCCLLLPLLLGLLFGAYKWFSSSNTKTVPTPPVEQPKPPVVGPVGPVRPVRPQPPQPPSVIVKPHSTVSKTEQLSTHKITEVETVNNTVVIDTEKCSPGFFFFNNQCIKCPSQSSWNSTHCVIKKLTKVVTTKTKEFGLEPKQNYGSSISPSSLSTTNTIFGWAVTASSSGASSASAQTSQQSSSSASSGKTVGEEMQQLGLDYNSMKKKWQSEGWSGTVNSEAQSGGNLVVEPIVEKRHHLRRIN